MTPYGDIVLGQQWLRQWLVSCQQQIIILPLLTNHQWGLVPFTRWIFHLRCIISIPWWRHQMEIFSALLAICAGNSPVTGEFPTQRPMTRSFDVYFDLSPNERLSKQSWGWWFETLSRSLWRHRNAWYEFENEWFKITTIYPRINELRYFQGQWNVPSVCGLNNRKDSQALLQRNKSRVGTSYCVQCGAAKTH